MGELDGRRAIVTGGASGIGRAVATRWAAEGADVLVADIDADGATRVADEIGADAARLDVASSEAWVQLVAEHAARPFDLAHLNAGVTTMPTRDVPADGPPEPPAEPAIPLADLTDAAYRRAMGVNLDGVVFGTRALVPSMCAAGAGDIVVTASLASLVPMAIDPIYGTNKHAVVGFVRSLGDSLQPFGVCISSLNPGFVDTAILGAGAADMLRQLGVPVIDPSVLADLAMHALRERRPGAQWVAWGDLPFAQYQWNPPFTLEEVTS
jgi:NAD(P)-dependent dehydrogenase (short-subunit alcohol dehydrogenase family)